MGMHGAINDQYRDIEGRLDVLTDGAQGMLPMLRPRIDNMSTEAYQEVGTMRTQM